MLCELVPGGVAKKIIADRAARLLESVTPPDAVAAARCELAAALIEDLRRIDAQLRETRSKPGTAVRASGTSLAGLFGVGPVIAAAIIGEVRDVSRFRNRDHFATHSATHSAAMAGMNSPRNQSIASTQGARNAGCTARASSPTQSAAAFSFVNNSHSVIHLFQYTRSARLQPVGTVVAGGHADVRTAVGDFWRVEDSGWRCLGIFSIESSGKITVA